MEIQKINLKKYSLKISPPQRNELLTARFEPAVHSTLNNNRFFSNWVTLFRGIIFFLSFWVCYTRHNILLFLSFYSASNRLLPNCLDSGVLNLINEISLLFSSFTTIYVMLLYIQILSINEKQKWKLLCSAGLKPAMSGLGDQCFID